MVALESRPESQPVQETEILDVDGFAGLYGRLLIASQASENEIEKILNPTTKGTAKPDLVDITEDRHYTPITQKLSSRERQEAWEGTDFDTAYNTWKTKFTDAISSTTDEKRIEAIKVLTGLETAEFKLADADLVYRMYCTDMSDTSSFVRTLFSRFKTDGTLTQQKLKELSPHIEWLAKGLFGKKTAEAVSKIIELETEIELNQDKVKAKVFADKDRINKLTDDEIRILKNLSGDFESKKAGEESAETPEQTIEQTPNITAQPESSTEKPKLVAVELKTPPEPITKRQRTRLRPHPITGVDLIKNNQDGKIYTIVGTSKDETTGEVMIHIKSDGEVITYKKKQLIDDIDNEGTQWDVFEPADFKILFPQALETETADEEEDFAPPPIKPD